MAYCILVMLTEYWTTKMLNNPDTTNQQKSQHKIFTKRILFPFQLHKSTPFNTRKNNLVFDSHNYSVNRTNHIMSSNSINSIRAISINISTYTHIRRMVRLSPKTPLFYFTSKSQRLIALSLLLPSL